VLRTVNLSTLSTDCSIDGTNGNYLCKPQTGEADKSADSAAKVEGPLGLGLAGGAVVAVGIGVWLLVSRPSSQEPVAVGNGLTIAPVLSSNVKGLVFSGSL
jgi:hypothetical protein